MKINSPCKNCRNRQSNCHGSCKQYKAYRNTIENNRKMRIQAKARDNIVLATKFETILKTKRRH